MEYGWTQSDAVKFTNQMFSSADEFLKDETRLLLPWLVSLVTLHTFAYPYIPSVLEPVYIFLARSRVSKTCLKAELCFHRYVHFPCVPRYIYISIFISITIYIYLSISISISIYLSIYLYTNGNGWKNGNGCSTHSSGIHFYFAYKNKGKTVFE